MTCNTVLNKNPTELSAGYLVFDKRIERGVSLHLTSILYPQNAKLSRKLKGKYEKWSLYPVLYLSAITFLKVISGQVLFVSIIHVINDYRPA
jgi:hypothetical protein